jgi:hypothetical protein
LAILGLALAFALGVKGLGGVLSIRARTASRELSGAFAMALGPDSFRSAILKVERANRHIDEFNSIVAAYQAEKFYDIWADTDAKGATKFFIGPIKPFPHTLPLIVGDIVHNLKSALDHTFTAIVGDALPMDDRMFPFCKNRPSDITKSARFNAIEKAIPGSAGFILDKVQPYEGGAGGLYGLHRLDRIDKHNELIVTANAASIGSLVIFADKDAVLGWRNVLFNVEQTTQIFGWNYAAQFKVQHDFKASVLVRFGQALPFGNEPVVPTLVNLSQRVGEIIETFAALTTKNSAP